MNFGKRPKPPLELIGRMIDDCMEMAFIYFRGADRMTTEAEFEQIDNLIALLTLKTEIARYISRRLMKRPRTKVSRSGRRQKPVEADAPADSDLHRNDEGGGGNGGI